jgi:hypothetical protein
MREIKAEDLREGDVFTFNGQKWYKVEAVKRKPMIAVYTADDVLDLDLREPVLIK